MKPQSEASTTGNIAIIGMSGRYPNGANSPELLWETLKSGVDAVSEAKGDRWDLGWHHPDAHKNGRVYTRAGGFLDRIDGFDADFFGMSPREVRQVDPQQRLLLELAWEAHEDAGIAPRSTAGSDTGVFVGISSNDYASLVGPGWPDAYSNTGSSFSIAANRISYIFDFHGPSVAVDTACSSALVCVHQACKSLLAGECTAALAGGVSILMHIRPWLGFAKASMLSPTGRCKSFDASGDGYVRSEGGGLVLLKRLADAERDGDRILGVIVGSGVNSDGRTMGLSMPNGEAQERLLRSVYSTSGLSAEDVFYVEAHGTGTAVGDPIECGALGRVLGEPRADGSHCLIGSVKSNIGHLEAASGIAGLTKALLTLKHGEIPGNLHFTNPNPKIEFEQWKLEVVTAPTPLPEREKPVVLGVNSFGFGGTNAHLALQQYRARVNPAVKKQQPEKPGVLLISGHSEAALQAVAQSYADMLRRGTVSSWAQICAAAATCRTQLRCRLALQASSAEEALTKLDAWLAGQTAAGLATGACASLKAPVAFVYSGNGPQWWGMGRELLAENEIFRDELEAVDAIFAPLAGWSLLDEMRKPESENRIALTEVAQPMLFALQLGLTRVVREAGIQASAVVGHSVGEAAAAYACGALTREQATRVIFHRSTEQGKTAGQGRMAALGVGPDEARTAMRGIEGWLELAAVNAPQAVTVAGDPAALEQLVQNVIASGKFARVLALNYPFHTKAMDPIREGLVAALHDLRPAATAIPFVSTVEGTEISGEALDAEYWYRNVREPVCFHDAIAHLLKQCGIAVFLEIGPHPVLKDYVQQSAKALEFAATALPTLRRPGQKGPEPESDNLANAICACHANGASELETMYTRPTPPPALPLYPWQHVRHWRGSVVLPDVFSPIEREHPLLGHRVPAADGLWENVADTNQLPYLKDHVVQNAVLFPAAGYIEMALAAGRIVLGKGMLDINDFEVLRPLTIPAHGDPLLQTSVDAKDGRVEISSRSERDSIDWTQHVRGRLSRGEVPAKSEAVNLAEISAQMPHAVSAEEHYRGASRRGLDYGPFFQGVSKVLLTAPSAMNRQALAEIKLEKMETSGLDGYLAHPALLDSCIQVLITLIGQNEKRDCSTIPVQLGRVRSMAPLTSRMFCQVIMRNESERSAVADFRVMDPDGNLLLTIDEARCQKVDFQHAGNSPLTSEWWRPDTLPALRTPAPLPEPAHLLGWMNEELEQIARDNHRAEFYERIQPQIQRLADAYAARALAALKPGEGSFDAARLGRRAGVKRDQLELLARLIRMAEQDGQLISANGAWRWNQSRTPECPDTLWRALFEENPRYYAELLLLAEGGESLLARLKDDSSGEPSAALLDQLFDTSPYQAAYNQVVRSALEKLMEKWPADRPIRILEIGGAAGALAAWVLPALPSERVDYVFTDASETALGRAEHRLAGHRFVRFAVLDLTLDFVEQGQPREYFDLVIGSHALSSCAGCGELLERLAQVMMPDGLLLLIEPNADRFSELVLGGKRLNWLDELSAAGFVEPLPLDDWAAVKADETTQQSVLVARRPALADAGAAGPGSSASRRWLVVFETEESPDVFCKNLVHRLSAQGHLVTVLHASDVNLSEGLADADEVVFIASPGKASDDVLQSQKQRCLTALQLVQTIEGSGRGTACQVTFVTRGAFPTSNGQGPIDPLQATLWGLGRVVGNEHASLNIRLIDVHSEVNGEEEAGWLATELLRRDAETEVQLSAGYRYVNRERLNTLADEARQARARAEAFVLDFVPHGGLDSLFLRAAERQAPVANQVEIAVEAAGLNFRDVLWTMGMLPEEAVERGFSGPTIGMECAGRIVRAGSDVRGLEPGDRVVAFASSCFRQSCDHRCRRGGRDSGRSRLRFSGDHSHGVPDCLLCVRLSGAFGSR